MDDHKATEKTLLELDDKIAEIQKEINLLTGGETSELGQAIQALQVAIELNNDRLLEAAREEDEEDEEALAITQQLDEAKEELETFITGLQSANEALAEALNELQEAQDEEQRIRAALATAGEQNQHLTDALASAEAVSYTHLTLPTILLV